MSDPFCCPRPFGVERFPITSREQWLELRKQDVTASAAACLVGIHPYLTAYALYLEKAGVLKEDGEMTPSMERGVELEEIAIRRIRKKHPTWFVTQPATYFRDPVARLGATPDAFATDPERPGFGVVQVKSVEPSIFRKTWRDEEGATEPPLWVAVQALVEAELTGATWAACAALVIGHGIDLHLVEVPLHRPILERIRAETSAFWRAVEEGKPPDPDFGRDAELIARLYSNPADGDPLDLTADNVLPALLDEDDKLRDAEKQAKKRRKEIKAEILHKLGNKTAAMIVGGVVFAPVTKRDGYYVKPCEYRSVRFRPEKPE